MLKKTTKKLVVIFFLVFCLFVTNGYSYAKQKINENYNGSLLIKRVSNIYKAAEPDETPGGIEESPLTEETPAPNDTPIDGTEEKPSPSPGSSSTPSGEPSPSPGETKEAPKETPSVSPSPRPTFIEPVVKPVPEPSQNVIEIPAPKPSVKSQLSPSELRIREQNREILKKRIQQYVDNVGTWRKPVVGICVETLDTGEVIYGKNLNRPMVPASNLKVVTTAAALALLGPKFQFETSLWGNMPDENGVMEGNLYLRGTGDPTFMEPFTNNPTEVYSKMAQVLKKRGIKVINGDVVGDDSAFDREFLGRGWKPRYLLYEYAAPAGALSINANTIRLVIKKGVPRMIPSNGYIQLVAKKKNQRSVYVTRKLGTDRVYIYGSSPGNVYRNLTINNPSKLAISAFAKILKANGIKITGRVRLIDHKDSDYMQKTHKVCFHLSTPLGKIVREINKESDNVCAQHVFKAISYFVKGKGTCDNSNEAIREFLKAAGINASGLRMADGSGLSEYNRITPKQLCEILRYMYSHPHGKLFYKSLPVAGKDGTLAYRMSGLNVHAKTGSLKGHIALSGYVKTNAKQILVFSIMTNYHPYSSGAIRHNENQLLKVIASFGGKL